MPAWPSENSTRPLLFGVQNSQAQKENHRHAPLGRSRGCLGYQGIMHLCQSCAVRSEPLLLKRRRGRALLIASFCMTVGVAQLQLASWPQSIRVAVLVVGFVSALAWVAFAFSEKFLNGLSLPGVWCPLPRDHQSNLG